MQQKCNYTYELITISTSCLITIKTKLSKLTYNKLKREMFVIRKVNAIITTW